MRNVLDDAIVDAVAESGGEICPQVEISYSKERNVFVAFLVWDNERVGGLSGTGSSTAEALAALAAAEELNSRG